MLHCVISLLLCRIYSCSCFSAKLFFIVYSQFQNLLPNKIYDMIGICRNILFSIFFLTKIQLLKLYSHLYDLPLLKYTNAGKSYVPFRNVQQSFQTYIANLRLHRVLGLGAVVAVIVSQLVLQPMQSVPITSNVVSSNPAHGVVYLIQL